MKLNRLMPTLFFLILILFSSCEENLNCRDCESDRPVGGSPTDNDSQDDNHEEDDGGEDDG